MTKTTSPGSCTRHGTRKRGISTRKVIGLSLVLGLVALAASLASAGPAVGDVVQSTTNEPIIQVSDDPFTNLTSQHRTEVEPDTLAFGSTWVSAFQAGRFFDLAASGIGFATSSDQGQSFVEGFLPGVTAFSDPPGPYNQAGDTAVAFDLRHHSWLISYLAVHAGPPVVVDVLVSRSADGVHWDLPVPVATLNAFLDKSWTVCDNSPQSPFFGNCYTEFTNRSQGSLLVVSTSSDGGLSWAAPRTVGVGDAGQPLVQPSGRVVMPFDGLCGGLVQRCAVSSDDGGMSWGEPVVISSLRTFHPTAPVLRSPPLPSAAIDGEGRIYVVWKDCRFEPLCDPVNRLKSTNDLVFSTSDDGVSWSEVRRIPLDPIGSNVDHFLPGIDVDPTSAGSGARLALTYYFLKPADCTRTDPATCELYVGFVSSTNGGQTWSVPEVLAGPMQLSWLAQTDQGAMVGDYISTSVLSGLVEPGGGSEQPLAVPAFAAALPPEDGTLREAIFTARQEIRGGHLPSEDVP
jgi:hypothetical protein